MKHRNPIIATLALIALLAGGPFLGDAQGKGPQVGRKRDVKNQLKAQDAPRPADRPQNLPDAMTKQPGPNPEGQPVEPWRNRRLMMEALNLMPQQQRQARQLMQRLEPRIAHLRDELEERHDAFTQALSSESFDPTVLQQRIRAVLEKQEEVLRAQAQMELAFRDILTPEQLAKFNELQGRQMEIRRLQRQVRQQQRRLMEELHGPPRP